MELKLKLKIKDTEIELSQKEVEELRDIIKKLFPEPAVVKEYVPWYSYRWSTPYWDYGNFRITYDTNTGGNAITYCASLT